MLFIIISSFKGEIKKYIGRYLQHGGAVDVIRKEMRMRKMGIKKEGMQISARSVFIMILDLIIIMAASFLALWIRFDFSYRSIDPVFLANMWKYMPLNMIGTIVVYYFFHLYTSLWKYAGFMELSNVVFAVAVSSMLQIVGMTIIGFHMPRSYWFIYLLFLLVFTGGVRFCYRFLRFFKNTYNPKKKEHVMIVGAGDAGVTILRELRMTKMLDQNVKCMIDDDPSKKGKYVQGCLVAGGREQIRECVDLYSIDSIIIAMPTAKKSEIKEILDICKQTGCKLSILPGTYQLISGEVSVSQLRPVDIEDLLGRDPIRVNLDEILQYIEGKTVMVTGGGGSIGSEICRQLSKHGVGKLIIVDIYENNAYAIQQELKRKCSDLNLETLIASVRNTNRMEDIFQTYHPDIVFHAAAHKHVPLMEDSPNEAIKNNVIGTYKTATMASRYGVKKFILISTDKAVNPTNIMGASKRLCEMVIQTLNKRSKTEFAAVRFGNVLGSNGSVIPLFKEQIKNGGPVTVTHPDIIRYFMTIPEAVSLVLQAGAYAKGGEIFVLNMGEPVKILDLATNLIRLSGFEPGEDIKIKFTGLRPGEKLYEELLMAEEGMRTTENNHIFIGKQIDIKDSEFLEKLKELDEASKYESKNIRELVYEVVPEYQYKKNA